MSAPETEFDEDRQLCDDGGCLGVVVDGKCNVCGLASSSPRDPSTGQAATSPRDSSTGQAATSPRDPSTGQASSSPRDPSTGQSATSPRDPSTGQASASADDGFDDDDRQLCPDGACTGLVGPDGKCKECGRSAAS